jgi:hypothetical protein
MPYFHYLSQKTGLRNKVKGKPQIFRNSLRSKFPFLFPSLHFLGFN